MNTSFSSYFMRILIHCNIKGLLEMYFLAIFVLLIRSTWLSITVPVFGKRIIYMHVTSSQQSTRTRH